MFCDKAIEQQERDHVRTISRPGFEADVFDMPLHRARRNREPDRDFLCRQSIGDEANYLALTARERRTCVSHNHFKLPPIKSLILKIIL